MKPHRIIGVCLKMMWKHHKWLLLVLLVVVGYGIRSVMADDMQGAVTMLVGLGVVSILATGAIAYYEDERKLKME